MGELLRNRGILRRSPDRLAIRCNHFGCRPSRTPGLEQAGGAYATPTIVHFGTVLLLSAVLSAPWHGIGGASLVWFLVGFAGVAYSIIVARRLRAHAGYQPVFEDWLFHALLPLVAYVLLHRHMRLAPIRTRPCLPSRLRHCYCFSAASTTHGTPLLTMSSFGGANIPTLNSPAETKGCRFLHLANPFFPE